MTRRGAIRALALGGVAALAAACGVKGPLEPLPSETVGTGTFPRKYPQEERPVTGSGGDRKSSGYSRDSYSKGSYSKE